MEHPPDPLRRVVRALCTTQIVAWGVLCYAFPVVASSISADEGWPLTMLVAAFNLAQLVSAACGLWVAATSTGSAPAA